MTSNAVLWYFLMLFLANCWTKNRVVGDLRRHDDHVTPQWYGSYDDVIKWKHFPRYRPFVRETTGHRWIPLTKASDALWCFFDLRLHKRLSRQPRRLWSEKPSRSLWRHRNGLGYFHFPRTYVTIALSHNALHNWLWCHTKHTIRASGTGCRDINIAVWRARITTTCVLP